MEKLLKINEWLKTSKTVENWYKDYHHSVGFNLVKVKKEIDRFNELNENAHNNKLYDVSFISDNQLLSELFNDFCEINWREFEDDKPDDVEFVQLGRTSSFYILPKYYVNTLEDISSEFKDNNLNDALYHLSHEWGSNNIYPKDKTEFYELIKRELDDDQELSLEDWDNEFEDSDLYDLLDDIKESVDGFISDIKPLLDESFKVIENLEYFKKNQVSYWREYLDNFLDDQDEDADDIYEDYHVKRLTTEEAEDIARKIYIANKKPHLVKTPIELLNGDMVEAYINLNYGDEFKIIRRGQIDNGDLIELSIKPCTTEGTVTLENNSYWKNYIFEVVISSNVFDNKAKVAIVPNNINGYNGKTKVNESFNISICYYPKNQKDNANAKNRLDLCSRLTSEYETEIQINKI